MVILWYILIFLFLLGFKAWWDKRSKSRGRIINHLQSAVIDTALYVASAWYLFGFLAIGGVVILSWGLRWLLYDLLYNFVNELPYNHLGENAKFDLWLKKRRLSQYFYKGLVIIVGVLIIVLQWIF